MNEKYSCIYQIKNVITNKLYIGQTKDYYSRIRSHLYFLRRGISDCKKLQYSFNKHGEDAFEFSIIEMCPEDELDDREIYWIEKLDTVDNGYNLCYGGGGLRGYKQSEDAIALRAAKKSIPIVCLNTGEVFDKAKDAASKYGTNGISGIRACCNGRSKSAGKDKYGERLVWANYNEDYFNMPEEERLYLIWEANQKARGIYNHNYGKEMSAEQKEKLSLSHKESLKRNGNPNKGKKYPERSGVNSHRAHAVVCVNTGERFDLIGDAALAYNISTSVISSCVSKKNAFAGTTPTGERLLWVNADEYVPMTEAEISAYFKKYDKSKSNHKEVICITTGEQFPSIKNAADSYSIHPSGITCACKGKCDYYGKHPDTNEKLYWKYA